MASGEGQGISHQESGRHSSEHSFKSPVYKKQTAASYNTKQSHTNSNNPATPSLQNAESQQPAAVGGEDVEKEDALGNEPQFSLANNEEIAPQNIYVHPEYRRRNPQYGKESGGPIWSLAQPLPRVVRPGMHLGEDRDGKHDAFATDTEEAPEEPSTEQPVEDGGKKIDTMQSLTDKQKAQGDNFFNSWGRVRNLFRESFAEWLGSTIAITIGLCSTFSRITSQGQAGIFESQSLSWGFAFMLGIYITGGISGGHLNPAISIPLSFFRGFPARRCAEYILAQVLGALAAGAISYGIYHDAIFNAASITQQTPQDFISQGFYTIPQSFVSPVTAFFNEFVGTAILLCTILAMGDHTNAPPGAGMQAFIVGLLIATLCMAMGYNSGGCFNPSRDLGPRFVALMAGYGGHLFKERDAWWVWGPWIATIAGGLFGAFAYDLLIFTGGESPVNYPAPRRKRALLIKKLKFRNKLFGRKHKRGDIEEAIRDA